MKKSTTSVLIKILISMVLLFGLVMQASAISLRALWHQNTSSGRYYQVWVSQWSLTDSTPTLCGGGRDWDRLQCRIKMYAVSEDGAIYVYNVTTIKATQKVMSLGVMLEKFNEQRSSPMPAPFILALWTSLRFKIKSACFGYSVYNRYAGYESPIIELASCYNVEKPPVRCEIKGIAAIDHKSMFDDEIDGAQASTDLNLECDGYAVVNVKASRTNADGIRLRSDDSLYSQIQVNGKDATTGIEMEITELLANPVHITSTLRAKGPVAPGPFTGYSLITIEPY